MTQLVEATLSAAERQAVETLVERLQQEFGDELIAVWLYGSRARGARPHPESDIDLLVITKGDMNRDSWRAIQIATDVQLSSEPGIMLSARVWSPEHLKQRREIESFFIQEVDRDKIVLYGEP